MNLYITNEFTMRQVLALYLEAWKSGVKTFYYVRSKSLEVEDCVSCSAYSLLPDAAPPTTSVNIPSAPFLSGVQPSPPCGV